MLANSRAKSSGSRPSSQNCRTDKEDEKNTIKAVVAAVSCTMTTATVENKTNFAT